MRVGNPEDVGLHGMKIPDDVDKYLGDGCEEEVVQEMGGILNNLAATKYVADVGKKLITNTKRGKSIEKGNLVYKFGIVQTDTPNAFALPNGSVYVTLGLLRLMKNDAELANVMGHEVGHVENRHSTKQLSVDLGTQGAIYLALALGGGSLDKDKKRQIKEFGLGLVSNGYSRDSESEADADGQQIATRAGYDPNGMTELMQLFLSMSEKKPEGIEAYMQSHPYAGDRLKEAKLRVPFLSKTFPQANVVGEESYKNFLGNILKTTPTQIAAKGAQAVTKFGPDGKAASPFDKDESNIIMIVGLSVIGVSLLTLGYLLLTDKE